MSRANGGDGPISVSYSTSNDSATGGDYSATSGTLNWADGEPGDKTFSVPITADSLSEGDETFFVNLDSPTGGALLGALDTAVVTIAGTPHLPPVRPSPTSTAIW